MVDWSDSTPTTKVIASTGLGNSSSNASQYIIMDSTEVSIQSSEANQKKISKLLPSFLGIVRRKWLLIAGVASIVTGLGVGYTLLTEAVLYTGSFQLLVEPVTDEAKITDPSSLARTKTPSEMSSLDYATQLHILQSTKMLNEILEQVQERYPTVNQSILKKYLTIGRVGGDSRFDQTKIIEVRYQAPDANLVKLVLEVAAQEYLEYSLNERKTNIGEGVKFIDEQLPELQQRVDTLRSQLQQMKQQYDIVEPQSQGEQVYTEFRQIANQQLEAQRQLQELRSLYNNLQAQLNLTPDEATEELTLREEPGYQSLLSRIRQLDVEIAEESTRFSSSSPTLQTLEDRRENLITLLEQESEQILGKTLPEGRLKTQIENSQSSVRTGLLQQFIETSNQIERLEVRNEDLLQNKNVLEAQVQQLPAIERQYNELQRQLELATRTLDQLLLQRETLQVEAAQKQVPWEIIAEPELLRDLQGNPVVNAVELDKTLIKMAGAGLVLGLALAILFERTRNIFYTASNIENATEYPLLGDIPRYQPVNPSVDSNTLVDLLEEDNDAGNTGAFIQGFEILYTNIRFLFSEAPVSSIAVCSVESGDGRSTVALHLAQTAALMGQRVLLVDANFRSPKLHKVHNLSNDKGLSDLLVNPELSPEEVIQRSQFLPRLHILTTGSALFASKRLLASAEMPKLMETLQVNYDLVIYDTPYLDGLMNTNFLAAHTDGILMVVGVKKTARSKVKQILQQLNDFRLPILGVVANHVPKRQAALSLEDFAASDLYPPESESKGDQNVEDIEVYVQETKSIHSSSKG